MNLQVHCELQCAQDASADSIRKTVTPLTPPPRARDAILENVHFIDRELTQLTAPRAVQEPIWNWCATFVEGWGEISAYLDRIVDCGRKYERVHPSSLRSGVEEDTEKVGSLMSPLIAGLRRMKEQIDAVEGATSIIVVLVTESAANIFNSCVKLPEALTKFLHHMKIDEADPCEAVPYPHWDFFCAHCRHPALAATLIPADARHPLQSGR
jgi:hypothetical protein